MKSSVVVIVSGGLPDHLSGGRVMLRYASARLRPSWAACPSVVCHKPVPLRDKWTKKHMVLITR